MKCITSNQVKKLDEILVSIGGSSASVQEFLESAAVRIVLHPEARFHNRVALCKVLNLDPDAVGVLHFGLDFERTLEEHARKASLCMTVTDIERISSGSEGFSYTQGVGTQQFEAKLFTFLAGRTRRQMRRVIYEASWTPAEPAHMLAFSAKYNSRHEGPVKFAELLVGLGRSPSTISKLHPGSEEWSQFRIVPFSKPDVSRSVAHAQYLAVREIA